ncbi:MAG: TraR/DksA C4-type zinc finger protein [Patescibacteria group bacterium]
MSAENQINKKTVEEIKASLLVQKKQILEDLNDISKLDTHEADSRGTQFPEYGDKPDENAQEISDFSTTVATQKILEKSLEDINKALDRIEKGTYGTCKYCGKLINEKRLMARPTAGACVACKTELQENE